jgi:hypothetical protein
MSVGYLAQGHDGRTFGRRLVPPLHPNGARRRRFGRSCSRSPACKLSGLSASVWDKSAIFQFAFLDLSGAARSPRRAPSCATACLSGSLWAPLRRLSLSKRAFPSLPCRIFHRFIRIPPSKSPIQSPPPRCPRHLHPSCPYTGFYCLLLPSSAVIRRGSLSSTAFSHLPSATPTRRGCTSPPHSLPCAWSLAATSSHRCNCSLLLVFCTLCYRLLSSSVCLLKLKSLVYLCKHKQHLPNPIYTEPVLHHFLTRQPQLLIPSCKSSICPL